MAVSVTRDKNTLKIEIPLSRPLLSKSGKTLVVASTRGLITTGVKCKGRHVVVVASAFIYPNKK